MSLYKPKAVYVSERQYTAASGEVQAPRRVFFEWRKMERGDWSPIGKANAVLRELHRSAVTNGSFRTPQSDQFSNRSLFRSLPMVMNRG